MSETGGIFVMLEAIRRLRKLNSSLKALFVGQPADYIKDKFWDFFRKNNLQDSIEVTGKLPYREIQRF